MKFKSSKASAAVHPFAAGLVASVIAAALGMTSIVNADVTWVGTTSDDWDTASNWSTNQVPGSSDDVVVEDAPNDPQLSSSAEINSLIIQDSGELTVTGTGILQVNQFGGVAAGSTLTIEADGEAEIDAFTIAGTVDVSGELTLGVSSSASGTSAQLLADGVVTLEYDLVLPALAIDANATLSVRGNFRLGGRIHLMTSSSILRILDDTTFVPGVDPTVAGSCRIRGENDSAQIEIVPGATLTNKVTVEGALVLSPGSGSGDAVFVNARFDDEGTAVNDAVTGIVRATAGDTLTLAQGLTILDEVWVDNNVTYRPLWAAVAANATLRFDTEALGDPNVPDAQLVGNFLLDGSNAVLMFNESIATYGGFSNVDGSVMVSSGEVFCWHNFDNCIEGQ